MDAIKKYIKENPWLDTILIITLVSIFAIIFGKHVILPLIDRGRELFLSEQVLRGNVPYKDITMIYFPTAYYINALIYKFLGVTINALVISQAIFCAIFMLIFYFLSKEFLSRTTSIILSILVITSCIFSAGDMFSYISPYSYSMIYGTISMAVVLFAIIKLFKTDKIYFVYIASIFSGFSFSCKLEFIYAPVLLIISLILYKKLKFVEYIKILILFLFFPVFILGVLFFQGVSIQDIINASVFAFKFSKTPEMTNFLAGTGIYPIDIWNKIISAVLYTFLVSIIYISCFISLWFYKKNKKRLLLLILFVLLFFIFFRIPQFMFYWKGLPLIIFLLLCFHARTFRKNKTIFILVIASLLFSQRVFFSLDMYVYGIIPLPFLLLTLFTLITNYGPKCFKEVKTEHVTNLFLLLLCTFYFTDLNMHRIETNYPLLSDKGILYVDEKHLSVLEPLLKFINNTYENDTILVIPEGNLINYLSNRKVDLHCFMMDKLYQAAYGENEAKKRVEKSKSEYIIISDRVKTNYIRQPKFYNPKTSLVADYINKNYYFVKRFISTVPDINEGYFMRLNVYKKKGSKK